MVSPKIAVATVLAMLVGFSGPLSAQSPPSPVEIDPDDIGGVLTGPAGPEAGVWIIAETREFQSRLIKAVVTDDQGRFVIPDVPAANYTVFARGYGLADSDKVVTRPGRLVNLTARAAATQAEAAKVYPAAYWLAMLEVPKPEQFAPGHRPEGMSDLVKDQDQWLTVLKNGGCVGCHQLGNLSTRTIPAAFKDAGGSEAQWHRRIVSGQAATDMINRVNVTGPLLLTYLSKWTDRIAAGETPKEAPRRPEGIERNIVVTANDWLDEKHYLHDLISSDRRDPMVNGGGPLYGATELSSNLMPILDPKTNTFRNYPLPVQPGAPLAPYEVAMAPSAYWDDEAIWDSRTNVHNQMFDQHGRVWMSYSARAGETAEFCRSGSNHPSARAFPNNRAERHLAVYDPRTDNFAPIPTCFGTHHLQFDKHDVLWTSGGGAVVGWLDMKTWDRTHDPVLSQGWTPLVLDTNGNGRRDAFVEPGAPPDPTKDRRINAPFYAVMPNPADDTIWGSVYAYPASYPGMVVRLLPGANPSETAIAEVYKVPRPGFGIRGADIDSKGVVWVSLASGHLGSFDRKKCRGPLNGPTATGDHCPDGWTFFRLPGPSFANAPDQSVEASYYTWVDQHNTLGLGKDVPIVTGNLFDGFHALVNGRFVTARLPYPLGFYAKGLDGRIDDPAAGWKGRGLWSSSGDRTPWQMEGGKGNRPLAVHVQVRPSPLAH